MSDQDEFDAVIGDGAITLPGPGSDPDQENGDDEMSVDLPPNIASGFLMESATNMQASNRNSRGVFDAAMGALAGTVQTNFAEVGVLEGRAVSGVMATPIASPSNPNG